MPNMTVIDVADADETRQVPALVADVPGPVYVRLKRGEIPVIFDEDHEFSLDQGAGAQRGRDLAFVRQRHDAGAASARPRRSAPPASACRVVNVPVIKPLDTASVHRGGARGRRR